MKTLTSFYVFMLSYFKVTSRASKFSVRNARHPQGGVPGLWQGSEVCTCKRPISQGLDPISQRESVFEVCKAYIIVFSLDTDHMR